MFPMMHSRFLLICCIIFSVIWLSSADPDCDCGPYERPVECIDQCQRCEYKNGGCAQPAVCIPGCDCIPGFFRNKQNQCIPAAFCPAPSPTQQCGVYEIPVKCIDQCQTCQYKNGNCTQGAVCIPGCDCIPGFFRNQQKQCIPAHLCPGTGPGPAQQCPAGEIPVGCIDRCQRCEYKNGNCAQIQVCTPGCNCVPGFLRDSTNKCIPANFCPDQCKSDEQFYPDIPDCKNTCEYINNPGTICPQYFAARPGCFCKKGLVKRKDGKCVKPENCGPPGFPCLLEVDAGPCRGYFPRFYFNKKTGQCEEFIYGGCKGNANNFEDKKLCEIVCKGPTRSQQCPAGEIPVECIDRCQRCEYKNGNCSQILICTPGCNCLPGFLRDSTNKCISADFCPGTGPGPAQQCPANEIPVGCIDRCQRCEFKNGNYCAQIQVCTPGCNCVPGFLRDSTNKCIPANFCPDQCKSDEQFYPDIPDCKNTCENYNNPGAICPQYFAARPGCFCKKGLVKRKDGKCVKPEDCGPPPGFPCSLEVDAGPCYGYFPRFYFNKKTGQCEEFIYGGCEGNANNFEDKKLCEIVCKGPSPTQQCGQYERPVECIDQCQTCEYRNGGCAQPAVCIPGCDCIPGFFRNKQKQCIPAAFCPGTGPGPAQQCPAYEYPVPCIDKCQTCEYKNGHCIQTGECTPGCNCVPGFLRDSTKKCIPASRCP